MKKVVLAPQGFKESLTGMEITDATSAGVKRVWPEAETVLIPVADGGDGTLQALVDGPQALHLDELSWFLDDMNIAREAHGKRTQLARQNSG